MLELFRESHANGLVSFLDTGAGGAGFSWTAGGGGGGGNLTGDIWPDRPCSPLAEAVESLESRGGSLGSRSESFVPSASGQQDPVPEDSSHARTFFKRDIVQVFRGH